MKTLYLVSAFASSMVQDELVCLFRKLSLAELKELSKNFDEAVSYIRHKPTMDLLKNYISTRITDKSNEQFIVPGDDIVRLIMIGLKVRPAKGTTDVSVSENDIELTEAICTGALL